MNKEIEKLQKISVNSKYAEGPNTSMVVYSFKVFERYIKGDEVLELGPAEGIMTDKLYKLNKRLSIVEGSKKFSDDLKLRYPNIEVYNCLFEEFRPKHLYDTIILGHVLEHVQEPVEVLKNVLSWLKKDGVVLAAVPNSRSLHRQAAVAMGILEFEEALNSLDKHHGHRRVYNPETFRHDFLHAGFKVDIFGGYWLKPVSNEQIKNTWTNEMLDAFMALGERYPDIAAEIYIVASKK